VELLDVYTGTGEMLTGSARVAQEAREKDDTTARRHEIKLLSDALGRRKKAVEAQVTALWDAYNSEMGEAKRKLAQLGVQENALESARGKMASMRGADRKTK
jgi:circadian clock protein KaiC